MASIGNDDGDAGFQIAPMVDVVFVLMLFFMASAGSQVAERELNINLPGSKTPSTAQTDLPPTPLMVDITGDGNVSVNNKAFGGPSDKEMTALREFFKEAIVQCGNKDPVIIRPESDTRHDRIMDVLNAAGAAGVKNLTFN
ncbi:MAG: biopolymer transporter ExbD [Chthoniobacteraceae bacterium]|nr:biopolymer transporter ExbD [Chthoniobacteraceae bacterium]